MENGWVTISLIVFSGWTARGEQTTGTVGVGVLDGDGVSDDVGNGNGMMVFAMAGVGEITSAAGCATGAQAAAEARMRVNITEYALRRPVMRIGKYVVRLNLYFKVNFVGV
jgi:hypothetical protein